jgi:predicted nucleotidyltransferase component of viral defense system
VIPRADIIAWRSTGHLWQTDAMVEQDLVISRLLVELFADDTLAKHFVFRGGTALHKLFLPQPLRYSEDIDLVQFIAGPIGPVFDRIRALLSEWLGEPRRREGPGVATLTYRFASEDSPPLPLRAKIEINTREHFSIHVVEHRDLNIRSRWFEGHARVPVYQLDELLATKLRALYQRRKGRDLFDLAVALRELPVDPVRVVRAFQRYMEAEGHQVSARELRTNVSAKLEHPGFVADMKPLLRPGSTYDVHGDFDLVDTVLLEALAGDT